MSEVYHFDQAPPKAEVSLTFFAAGVRSSSSPRINVTNQIQRVEVSKRSDHTTSIAWAS